MIVKTQCSSCNQDYEIIIETGDLDALRKNMKHGWQVPCPMAECPGFISLTGVARQARPTVTMTGKELLAALGGA